MQSMNPSSQKALYLYCLTRGSRVATASLKGVDNSHPVFTRDYGDITAVLSQVDLTEFVGQAAAEQMRNAAWITPRACRHQEVIARINQQTDLFPARFGTIFSTDLMLAGLIGQHHKQIHGFLNSVRGHAEWALKGFLDRDKAIAGLYAEALEAQTGRLAGLSPGLRYFEEKKIQASASGRLNHWLITTLNTILRNLSPVASRNCLRELLSRKATGAERDMVLNSAFLVAHNDLKTFLAKVDELNQTYSRTGLAFELSGPWPAYSFCPVLKG